MHFTFQLHDDDKQNMFKFVFVTWHVNRIDSVFYSFIKWNAFSNVNQITKWDLIVTKSNDFIRGDSFQWVCVYILKVRFASVNVVWVACIMAYTLHHCTHSSAELYIVVKHHNNKGWVFHALLSFRSLSLSFAHWYACVNHSIVQCKHVANRIEKAITILSGFHGNFIIIYLFAGNSLNICYSHAFFTVLLSIKFGLGLCQSLCVNILFQNKKKTHFGTE